MYLLKNKNWRREEELNTPSTAYETVLGPLQSTPQQIWWESRESNSRGSHSDVLRQLFYRQLQRNSPIYSLVAVLPPPTVYAHSDDSPHRSPYRNGPFSKSLARYLATLCRSCALATHHIIPQRGNGRRL